MELEAVRAFHAPVRRLSMLLLIIVLLLLFGAGGGYYGYSRWGARGAWNRRDGRADCGRRLLPRRPEVIGVYGPFVRTRHFRVVAFR
jgi:hypothetical protein